MQNLTTQRNADSGDGRAPQQSMCTSTTLQTTHLSVIMSNTAPNREPATHTALPGHATQATLDTAVCYARPPSPHNKCQPRHGVTMGTRRAAGATSPARQQEKTDAAATNRTLVQPTRSDAVEGIQPVAEAVERDGDLPRVLAALHRLPAAVFQRQRVAEARDAREDARVACRHPTTRTRHVCTLLCCSACHSTHR